MKKERNVWWLIAGVSGISLLAWFINTYNPDTYIRHAEFFLLLFFSVTSLSIFVIGSMRRAVFVGIGLIIFLLLRLIGLREPLYPILLTVSLVSLELYLNKQ